MNEIPGWMSEQCLTVLDVLTSKLIGTVVEIGSFHGRSAAAIAANNKNINLYCLDLWDSNEILSSDGIVRTNSLEVFKLYTSHIENITPIQITDIESLNWNYGLVDLVFLDAEHKNPSDWEWIQYFLPKIKSGGVLCGHDYSMQFPHVIQNAQQLSSLLNQKITFYPGTSIWSFRIN